MLKKTLIDRIDSIEPPDELKDPKTQLQEIIQREINEQPKYHVIRSSGPDHQPTFTMRVELRGVELGRGSGGSKKQAERTAARNAMEQLKKRGVRDVLGPARDGVGPDG
jgi:ribonuclease-3